LRYQIRDARARGAPIPADVTREHGTSRVNVGRIERDGDMRPSMARKLATALDVEVDDLMRQPPDA
jgi:hypothetical protein